jgi:hypothetical protein
VSPREREKPAPTDRLSLDYTNTQQSSADSRQPYRAPCGLRANGFREGHYYGRRDACRRLWEYLTTAEGRELAVSLAAEGLDDD